MESAKIISDYSGQPIIINKNINERGFGSLVGKKWIDIPEGSTLRELDLKLEYDYRPHGGESVDDVANRVQKFIDTVKSSNYESALVVTSRGVIQLLYKLLENKKSYRN